MDKKTELFCKAHTWLFIYWTQFCGMREDQAMNILEPILNDFLLQHPVTEAPLRLKKRYCSTSDGEIVECQRNLTPFTPFQRVRVPVGVTSNVVLANELLVRKSHDGL